MLMWLGIHKQSVYRLVDRDCVSKPTKTLANVTAACQLTDTCAMVLCSLCAMAEAVEFFCGGSKAQLLSQLEHMYFIMKGSE